MRALASVLILVGLASYSALAQPTQQDLYSKLQHLGFEENKGQVSVADSRDDGRVLFVLKAEGITVFFGRDEVIYQWERFVPSTLEVSEATGLPMETQAHGESGMVERYQMGMKWQGANPNLTLYAESPQSGVSNFYLKEGMEITGVKKYEKLLYRNVYKNIDIQYYFKDGKLKYDILLHPGSNPDDIQFNYTGHTSQAIEDGQLITTSPFGSVVEGVPVAFNSDGMNVDIKYTQHNGFLGFDLDSSGPLEEELTIDPWIFVYWHTYFGSTGEDYGEAVASGPNGNVFLGGYTSSSGSVLAYNGFQSTHGGGPYDAFVAKFDDRGTRIWSTYFGGTGTDKALSIAAEPSGNVVIAGETNSAGLGFSGHQNSPSTGYDGFVAKFSNTGTRIWSSYYGGTNDDFIRSILVDVSGNIYFAGQTASDTGIGSGGYDPGPVQGIDAFLVKFNAVGVRQWGTYYGDIGIDSGYDIDTDLSGNIYLIGETFLSPNMSTNGSVNQGLYDAFVAKFNPAGNRVFASYYGGPGDDNGRHIANYQSGDILMAGITTSASGISGATVPGIVGKDAFIMRLNGSGTWQWGKYYGGGGDESPTALEITNQSGEFLFSWQTFSSEFARLLACDGSGTIIDDSGYGMNSGNPLPRQYGRVTSIDIGPNGTVYVGGSTLSDYLWVNTPFNPIQGFPNVVPWQPGHQQVIGGGHDAFLYKLKLHPANISGHEIPGGIKTVIDASGHHYIVTNSGVAKRNAGSIQLNTIYTFGAPRAVHSMAIDATGNLIIVGVTSSTSGIASGGHQNIFGGYEDGFVMKISPTGALIWSTYYGGASHDHCKAVSFDASNNIYVAGQTYSSTNISTLNSYGGTGAFGSPTGGDGFIVKFNPQGQRQWGKYFGGPHYDRISDIKVSASDLYAVGHTRSTSGIAVNGFQNSIGGESDMFLGKLNLQGGIVWATYYGGPSDEQSDELAVGPGGEIYFAGQTRSSSGIASGGHQNSYGGGDGDAFLVKMTPAGARTWSTYYGGSGMEMFSYSSLAVDAFGNVYLGGGTKSSNNIAYMGQQINFAPNNNGYVSYLAKLTSNGERLWGTYYYAYAAYSDPETRDIVSVGNTFVLVLDDNGLLFYLDNISSSSTLEPLTQATGLSITAVTHNSMQVSFTSGADNPDAYIVIRKQGSAPTANPIDGTSYTVGATLGDGVVVSIGGTTSFTSTGLINNTAYYYKVFAFNGSGGLSNYRISSPLAGNATTLQYAIEPTAQPTAFSATNIALYSMTVNFLAAAGNPAGYLVLRKAGSAPTGNPVDGVSYTIGQGLGDATVIHSGPNLTVQSTSLSKSTNYHYRIFSFNGNGTATNYRLPSPLTGNATTLTYETEPGSQPTNLYLNPSVNSITVSFTTSSVAPFPDGYLVLRRQGAWPSLLPVDGVSHSVPEYLADASWVISANSNNYITDDGLNPETDYYYRVYAFRGSSTEINYLTVNPLFGTAITDTPEPPPPPPCGQFCERVTFEGITIAATWENGEAVVLWENEDADDILQLTLQRSLDGSEFTAINPIWNNLSPASKKSTDLEAKNLPSEHIYYRMSYTSRKRVKHSPAVNLQKTDRLPDVKISPNPAGEYIVVEGASIVYFDLMDATGKPLQNRVLPGQLSVKDLSPGLYLIRVYPMQGQPQTVKIIVHR